MADDRSEPGRLTIDRLLEAERAKRPTVPRPEPKPMRPKPAEPAPYSASVPPPSSGPTIETTTPPVRFDKRGLHLSWALVGRIAPWLLLPAVGGIGGTAIMSKINPPPVVAATPMASSADLKALRDCLFEREQAWAAYELKRRDWHAAVLARLQVRVIVKPGAPTLTEIEWYPEPARISRAISPGTPPAPFFQPEPLPSPPGVVPCPENAAKPGP